MFYAFIPEVAIPSTMYFWKTKKIIKEGSRERVPIAKIALQSVEDWGSLNMRSASETVKLRGRFR
jgi:hypothetical protein